MPSIAAPSRRLIFSRGWILALLLSWLFAPAARLNGQSVPALFQGKALYVDTFDGGAGANELRQSVIKHLRKSSRCRIVDTPGEADAIVTGNGQIWVRGHLTANLRTPSTNRQTVYGGFLSVEVTGKDKEPLWSYLVTPSRFAWASIVDDLANNMVKEMLSASGERGPSAAAGGVQHLSRTTLAGSGATFPAPLYKKWFESFERLHPEVQLTYEAVGSETGTQKLVENKVDFAASDVSNPNVPGAPTGSGFRRIASVLGAVVPIYNVNGPNQDLRFTPEALAGIYLGRITKWNDPEIANSNKGVGLPNASIVVIHRQDGSGTTYTWSDFLSKTSPDWKSTVGTGVDLKWPVGNAAKGNDGVAAAVQATPNSIGYVELVYAIQHRLSFGAVRNSSGEYIRAGLDSLSEAARAASSAKGQDSLASITNAPGKGAYPIATFTWLLFPQSIQDPAKKSALIALLKWVLTSGQKDCSALGYAPLPREVAAQQLDLLNSLN